MNVLFIDGELTEHPALSTFQSAAAGIEELGVSACQAEDLLYAVKTYCNSGRYPYAGGDSDRKLVLVLDSSDIEVVEKLLLILSNPLAGVAVPRIILLSSLLTWAGKSVLVNNQWADAATTSSSSQDADNAALEAAFWKRQPLPGSHELYCLENKLIVAENAEVSILGVGCVYGGKGYDVEAIFKDIWNFGIAEEAKKVQLKSMFGGENKVPMIHYNDLAQVLMSVVSFEGTLPKFLPVSDCANLSLNETMSSVLSYVDGKTISAAEGLECMGQAEIADEMVNESSLLPKTLLWSLDLAFPPEIVSKYSGNANIGGRGMLDGVGDIWSEFTSGHSLNPISVFITGNPQSGKTTGAKAIQSMFQCQYVDAAAAVSHVLKSSVEENSAGSVVKGEVMAVVEAKVAEGKKAPKKGEAEEPEVIDPLTVEVDDALLEGLPVELKRKCLTFMLKTDKLCLRRGYVMDVWNSGVISSHADLTEVMSELPVPPPPVPEPIEGEGTPPADAADAAADAADAEAAAAPAEEGSVEAPAAPVPVYPEIIVEIQTSDEVLTARLHAEHGIEGGDMKKASKEAQAAVKDFETRLGDYKALVEEIPVPEPEPVGPIDGEAEAAGPEEPPAEPEEREFTHSHKAVLEIEGAETCPSKVFRIKADVLSLEKVVMAASRELVATHGEVGWLSAEQKAAFVPAAPAPGADADSSAPAAALIQSDGGVEESKGGVVAEGAAVSDVAPQLALYGEMCDIVNTAKETTREGLVTKAVELQDYLLENLMSELAKAMIDITQNKPDDPLMALANHLEKVGMEQEEEARKKAEVRFYELLAKSEAGETTFDE